MLHPALKNNWSTSIYAGSFALLGLAQTLALLKLIDIPLGWLIADGLLFGLLFAAVSIPLWMVVQFVDFSKGDLYQQILSSFALCVLTIASWQGIGILILYIIFPESYFEAIIPSIPMRVIGGALLYIILVQHYNNIVKKTEIAEENKEQEEQAEEEEITKKTATELLDRIAVKVGQKIHVINSPEIIFIQAEGDYVMIHTRDGKYLKEATMKYLEEHLPSNIFVRVHRSCIVNIETISRIELYEKQNYILILQNGEQLKTSSNGYKQLKKVLSL